MDTAVELDTVASSVIETASDAAAGPAEDGLISFEVLTFADIQDCENVATELQTVLTGTTSDVWSDQYLAVESIRRLCKYHPGVIVPHVSTVLKLVLDSATSLRSAVTRNALWCLADMFACIPEAMLTVIDPVIDVLVLRAANDKKFIRDAAAEALRNLSKNLANMTAVESLSRYSTSKSLGVCAASAQCMEQCMEGMGGVGDGNLTSMVKAVSSYYNGKSTDARKCAVNIIHKLKAAFGIEAFEACLIETLSSMDSEPLIRVARTQSRAGPSKHSGSLRDQIRAARSAAGGANAKPAPRTDAEVPVPATPAGSALVPTGVTPRTGGAPSPAKRSSTAPPATTTATTASSSSTFHASASVATIVHPSAALMPAPPAHDQENIFMSPTRTVATAKKPSRTASKPSPAPVNTVLSPTLALPSIAHTAPAAHAVPLFPSATVPASTGRSASKTQLKRQERDDASVGSVSDAQPVTKVIVTRSRSRSVLAPISPPRTRTRSIRQSAH